MSRKVYRFPCGCTFNVLEESSDPDVMPLLDFDINAIPDTCPATWQMLGRGDTKGVFQLESSLGRQWTRKLKPESDEHMGALGALLRPGPLMGVDDEGVSLTEHYVRRKNGLEPVEDFHPALAPILATTYGVLTYQEQSMRIARDLAGFDLVAVDRLRKGIGKKDQKLLASLGEEFKAGCRKVGLIDEATIERVWEWIRATGRYQFNKAHSTCYGLRGYKTAYIKAHFPVAFFASWLKHASSKPDPQQEVAELVSEARLFGVTVEPPDLRTLEAEVQTDGKCVKFGLASIKGVGTAQVVRLREAVAEGEAQLGRPLPMWTWLEHLVFLAGKVSSSVMEKFVQAGALRYLGMQRQQQLEELKAWNSLTDKELEWLCARLEYSCLADALEALGRPRYRKPKKKTDPEPEGPFGGCSSDRREEVVRSLAQMLRQPSTPLVDTPLWLSWIEEQLLGISLTASRVDSCDLSAVTCTCKDFMTGQTGHLVFGVVVQQVREVRTKKGKSAGSKMAFLSLDDGSCTLNDVVVFPEVWREFSHLMTEGSMVILQGERDFKNKEMLVVKKVWEAAQAGFPA